LVVEGLHVPISPALLPTDLPPAALALPGANAAVCGGVQETQLPDAVGPCEVASVAFVGQCPALCQSEASSFVV